jgi:hypothetical protein
MTRRWINSTAALFLLIFSASCAEEQFATLSEPKSSPFEPVDFKLLINGQSVTEIQSEEQISRLVAGLEEDGPDKGNLSLAERIERLLSQKEGRGELGGLAAIPSRTALEVLQLTLDDQKSLSGPIELEQKGQIQQSVDGEPGFYFKPGDPMHVWVQMTTTVKFGGSVVFSKAEMYRVQVPANQAAVERRAGTGPSVFPGFENVAFAVPASVADRVDANGNPIQFQYKLWADGTDVEVTNYWLDLNATDGLQWNRYTPANAPVWLQGIFNTDADSCFDMMFQLDPSVDVADGGALDDGLLPPGSKPPYYCLGRCTDPLILNTQ